MAKRKAKTAKESSPQVIMYSDEFGIEDFGYDTIAEAEAGLDRLKKESSKAFKKDRTEFSGRPFDGERLKAGQPMAREQTYAQLSLAEQILRDGRPFLLGAVPSLADCALYNPVWFLQVRMGAGDKPSPLDRLPKIVAWSARMKALGEGKRTDIKAADALEIAKAANPAPTSVDANDPSGLTAGRNLSITPDDTGKVPVTGTLVGLTADRISIARNDPRVGDVVVHFPRAGFIVQAASPSS